MGQSGCCCEKHSLGTGMGKEMKTICRHRGENSQAEE